MRNKLWDIADECLCIIIKVFAVITFMFLAFAAALLYPVSAAYVIVHKDDFGEFTREYWARVKNSAKEFLELMKM